ncbi:MAG: 4Fe-4S dicluster domain-containing protein [Verrucomicrobia bacterium]|nr:4Fe-4S dicluster domain-containing protein [Verrucomicrobiota bacterium]
MKNNRRRFLQGITAGGGALFFSVPASASNSAEYFPGWPDRVGLLMDLSLCIGCRKCEEACKAANQLPPLRTPLEDLSIFERERRTDAENYTVVNRYANPQPDRPPVYVKEQCMHCEEPACASACLVGALSKSPEGAVIYNKNICLGCRYCMIACPFNIPAYEYFNPTSPQVRKCTLCHERISRQETPACAKICPNEAITFGKKSELIDLAREKIRNHPGKYQNHLYGVSEAGGTSWLYLSELPFERLGFPADLGTKPFPEFTRGFLSMVPAVFVIWPALLGGLYAFTQSRKRPETAEQRNQANQSNPA